MRKEVYFLLTFLILCVSYASASVVLNNYTNTSVQSSYYVNEPLTGSINLTIINEPINSVLKTNLGQSVNIKTFLDNNHVGYSCSTYNCTQVGVASYTSSDSNISILYNTSSFFGFYAEGNSITITGLSFQLSSDFGQEMEVPLKLKFFGKSLWSFNKSSTDYTRSVSYGCFVPAPTNNYTYKIVNNSMYCEKITALPETSSVLLGAITQGSGSGSFKMTLLNSNKQLAKTCTFTAPDTSCIPSTSSSLSAGDYYLCITALDNSNYSIASENLSQNCGWFGGNSELPNTANATIDYGVYVKTPKFASAEPITIDVTKVPNIVADANSYLQTYYPNKNCASGCVLPIEAMGVTQTLGIKNVQFQYNTNQGPVQSSSFSALTMNPSKFNFSGRVELSYANLSTGPKGNKSFELLFNSNSLFTKAIKVLSSSVIYYVTPAELAAALENNFTVVYDSDKPISKFKWNFGDNTTLESVNNTVKHTYSSVGVYYLSIELTDSQNITVSKTFNITVGSPKELINISMNFKNSSLQNAVASLNLLPSWYKPAVERASNLSYFQDQLRSIDSQRSNALTDQDYTNVFNLIYALNVPYSFSILQKVSSPILPKTEYTNPSIIQDYIGGSVENLEDYNKAISSWQEENIFGSMKLEKVGEVLSDSTSKILLTAYSMNITSRSSDESYIVLNKDFDSIVFKEDVGAKKQGNSTLLTLDAASSKVFSFYALGDQDITLFVSPKLSKIPVVTTIAPCNFNKRCEKDQGEDYGNCRSDCFPVGPTILWITIIIFLGLVGYMGLAYWYKTRYETFLFKDRRALYNLLMFITNARVSGMSDRQITDELKKQKWSSEQITYAIKKSKGERTGLPELIPFDKISASMRENKAKQNINKGKIQGINKW